MAFLRVLKGSGVMRLAAKTGKTSVPILCYHGTWPVNDGFTGNAMFIRPQTFAQRMQLIEQLGLNVVALSDAVAGLRGEKALADNSVVITIDDGWYGTFRHMMPALLKHGFPATLYCDTAQLRRGGIVPHMMTIYARKVAGEKVVTPEAEAAYKVGADPAQPYSERHAGMEAFAAAIGFDLAPYKDARVFEYMSEAQLKAWADAGLDVQLHTHNHTMGDLSVEVVRDELKANAMALSEILQQPPERFKHFCYPSGVTDPMIADRLLEDGVESATTTIIDRARSDMHLGLLPRILDGDNLSEIELESEITGFAPRLRKMTARPSPQA